MFFKRRSYIFQELKLCFSKDEVMFVKKMNLYLSRVEVMFFKRRSYIFQELKLILRMSVAMFLKKKSYIFLELKLCFSKDEVNTSYERSDVC